MTVRLATGPVSWGVDFAGAPGNPPWDAVLDGIAAAGLRWTELGPLGYLPAHAGPELARRGLKLCAGFVFAPLAGGQCGALVDLASRTAARVAALGGRFLVLIDAVGPERATTAGRPDDARRLGPRGRSELRRAVAALADVARRHELHPVLHNHAGSHVEFRDEIEPLLEVVDLCLDTGHAAYAELDPVALYREWGDRIPYLHLKDVDPARRGRDFWTSVRVGAFRPLGEGVVDFAALLAELDATGFDGWCTIEQDREVRGGDPVADLIDSRRHLEEVGKCVA